MLGGGNWVESDRTIRGKANGGEGAGCWTGRLLSAGLGHYLDGYSVHPSFALQPEAAGMSLLGQGYRFNFAFYITDYAGEPGCGYYYTLDRDRRFGADKVSPKAVVPAYAAQSFLLDGTRRHD